MWSVVGSVCNPFGLIFAMAKGFFRYQPKIACLCMSCVCVCGVCVCVCVCVCLISWGCVPAVWTGSGPELGSLQASSPWGSQPAQTHARIHTHTHTHAHTPT